VLASAPPGDPRRLSTYARGRSSAGIAAFGRLLARSAIPTDLLALTDEVLE